MATQGRTILKGYFNTGDKPTEAEFVNLIDSGVNWVDDLPTQAEATAGSLDTKLT